MKPPRAALSKTPHLHDFLQKAPEHIPDLLALDEETAWKTVFPDRPIPSGLQSIWRRTQAEQAALRALQAATPLEILLQTEKERRQLARQLLSERYAISDPTLIAWMRNHSPSTMRLFKEQVEQLYPRINVPGYRAIAAEAARLGWPKLFREDLAIDFKLLCTPDAPKHFWWGVRPTGTDIYRPNEVWDLEWAQAAQKQGSGERRYYWYNGQALHSITLDALIVQLDHTLDVSSYEQASAQALAALTEAKHIRLRDWEGKKAYEEALQASRQAEEALRKVKRFKQQ